MIDFLKHYFSARQLNPYRLWIVKIKEKLMTGIFIW